MKNNYILSNNLLIESSINIDPVLLTSLEDALILIRQELHSFANQADFVEKMTAVFGEEIGVYSLKTAWMLGDFSIFPNIEIRNVSELNGANGAYSSDTNRIYLSWEFLQATSGNSDDLVGLLLEEFGHRVDSLLNTQDSAGDEGAIFSA